MTNEEKLSAWISALAQAGLDVEEVSEAGGTMTIGEVPNQARLTIARDVAWHI